MGCDTIEINLVSTFREQPHWFGLHPEKTGSLYHIESVSLHVDYFFNKKKKCPGEKIEITKLSKLH